MKVTTMKANGNTKSMRLMTACALSMVLCSMTAQALETGDAAPALKLPTATASAPMELAALKGKVVYVDFWASWCGPCKQSFPWMNDMQSKYAERGLEVVAINVDAKMADAQKFLAISPARFTVAFDAAGVTPKQFAIKGMPTSYLIDREGKITRVHSGFRDSDRSELEGAIVAALNSEKVKK
jgi:cytochrome c biogenesis protein CcmG, thiol:disulfide interchange protein DsbE